MKTLRVTLEDILGPVGPGHGQTSPEVWVRYVDSDGPTELVTTAGAVVTAAKRRLPVSSGGVVDVPLYASDDAEIEPEFHGFGVQVGWDFKVRGAHGASSPVSGSKVVLVETAHPEVSGRVLFGALGAFTPGSVGPVRDLTAGTNLNDVVRAGWYGVGSLTITNRPVDLFAVLTVQSQATAIVQTYVTTSSHQMWVRRGNADGTGWQAWKRMDAGVVDRGIISNGVDLNSLVAFGTYGVASGTNTNRPVAVNGTLTVTTVGVGIMQSYLTVGSVPQSYVRRGNSDGTGWQTWVRTDLGGVPADIAAETSALARRSLLAQALTARKGGRIGTSGKGAVALRFDDNNADFVSKVLPLLIARRLPFTRVTTSDRTTAGDGGTWADMQTYLLDAGGEVWNHGKSHGDASGSAALNAEILGALTTIRTQLPRVPVDCWAPPGGSGSIYDGHLPSSTVTTWADTYAGRLITGHHALASGYLGDTYYRPLDGVLRDGQVHYSNDARTVAATKDLVDRARDWVTGVVLMWHPNNLDSGGSNMTTAGLTEVLDYIVAERDAGDLEVLTVSGLAVADASSTFRRDLLTTHSSAGAFSESIVYPQFRQGVRGATVELLATVAGTAGATVTSVVAESTRTHTIPVSGTLALRHVATIPTDVTGVTVTISAACSAVQLRAV